MKSAVAITALLCAPEVFALALPHIPKLNSRWYHKDELDKNDATLYKRWNADNHGHELKPRAAGPLVVARPSTTPISTGPTGPSSTGPLGMLPRPAATHHNPYVGNHPFVGHGPVVLPTAAPSSGTYSDAFNFTLTYAATGTTPPISNATATIYLPPIVYPITNTTTSPNGTRSCDEVPELIDSNGNFLPGDQQPKYNGSSHCTPTSPSSSSTENAAEDITYAVSEPEVERVEIEGHVVGNSEIVEVEVTSLPFNISSWNNTADANYGSYYGANPTGYVLPTGTGLPSLPSPTSTVSLAEYVGSGLPTGTSAVGAAGTSTVPRQRVPDAGTPGFTGPKVRRRDVVYPELGSDEKALADADIDFD